MTIRAENRDLIVLEGHCPSEEAEILLQRLLAAPTATLDLRSTEGLHTAVIQVILAARPKLRLPPAEGDAGLRFQAQLRSIISL